MVRQANSALPENEPRGSNSSKLSTSFLSATGATGADADETEAGGEAGAGFGAEVFAAWAGLRLGGGEDDLGANVGGSSPTLQVTNILGQYGV